MSVVVYCSFWDKSKLSVCSALVAEMTRYHRRHRRGSWWWFSVAEWFLILCAKIYQNTLVFKLVMEVYQVQWPWQPVILSLQVVQPSAECSLVFVASVPWKEMECLTQACWLGHLQYWSVVSWHSSVYNSPFSPAYNCVILCCVCRGELCCKYSTIHCVSLFTSACCENNFANINC